MKRNVPIIALVLFGASACGQRSDDPSRGRAGTAASSAGGPSTVVICHIPHGEPQSAQTLSVPSHTLAIHLAHGDVEGSCDQPVAPVAAQISIAPNACCNDPTCDRAAFAKAGGICAGDPRIKGPLPVTARSGQTR